MGLKLHWPTRRGAKVLLVMLPLIAIYVWIVAVVAPLPASEARGVFVSIVLGMLASECGLNRTENGILGVGLLYLLAVPVAYVLIKFY